MNDFDVPGSGDVCTTVKEEPPYSTLTTTSIPVYATGTSATLNVMASMDFFINLQQNDTQYPPAYTGYQFLIGGWTNTVSKIRWWLTKYSLQKCVQTLNSLSL
jgi:hypothetical protein